MIPLGASLANPIAMHPANRIALTALDAHPKVLCVLKDLVNGPRDLFLRCRIESLCTLPTGPRRVRLIPSNQTDHDPSLGVGGLSTDELSYQLLVIHRFPPKRTLCAGPYSVDSPQLSRKVLNLVIALHQPMLLGELEKAARWHLLVGTDDHDRKQWAASLKLALPSSE